MTKLVGVCGLTHYRGDVIGSAYSGKDTVADRLVQRHGYLRISLADEIKRICMRLWDFTEEQMWGSLKDVPDKRYQQPDGSYLTPRFAMQRMGTEVARKIDRDVWVRYVLRLIARLEETGTFTDEEGRVWQPTYRRMYPDVIQAVTGQPRFKGVVIPDIRFQDEADAVEAQGGTLVCVERSLDLEAPAGGHVSEDTAGALLERAKVVLQNDYTIESLGGLVDQAVESGAW